MVLFPNEFKISRSLGKTLRQKGFEIRLDSAFADVIGACATVPRPGQNGTWISPDMQSAYIELHRLGWAHSVETWIAGKLAGGLYGLALGHMFFGESMFSRHKEASKIALAHLCRFLATHDFGLIDCQMYTPHLASLGARPIQADDFQKHLQQLTGHHPEPAHWPTDAARFDW